MKRIDGRMRCEPIYDKILVLAILFNLRTCNDGGRRVRDQVCVWTPVDPSPVSPSAAPITPASSHGDLTLFHHPPFNDEAFEERVDVNGI